MFAIFHSVKELATQRNTAQAARASAGEEQAGRAGERILGLLTAVADAPDAALSELARTVGLAPSTALRHLRTLEATGFVQRVDDGYRPGAELYRIGLALAAQRPLPVLAQPVLDELAAATGESAYLGVPADARHASYAAMAPGRHTVRHTSWLGQQVPRRATAVGAALAGRVDDDGAAVRRDAVEEGVTAVAAPVRGGDRRVVAAVSVVGPSFRLRGRALTVARAHVVVGAEALARALGGQ